MSPTVTAFDNPADASPSRQRPEGDPWAIVDAVQNGDRQAFGLLYQRYRSEVYRYLVARTGNAATAEDLTGETFLRAFRGIWSVSNRGADIRAWFLSIARNLTIDHIKSARTRHEVPTGEIVRFGRVVAGPEDLVVRGIQRQLLHRGLSQLTPEQRTCVALRFLREMSVVETAEAMNRDVRAVRALQYRAVRRLAALLLPGETAHDIAG